jgi:hypothetical protein
MSVVTSLMISMLDASSGIDKLYQSPSICVCKTMVYKGCTVIWRQGSQQDASLVWLHELCAQPARHADRHSIAQQRVARALAGIVVCAIVGRVWPGVQHAHMALIGMTRST